MSILASKVPGGKCESPGGIPARGSGRAPLAPPAGSGAEPHELTRCIFTYFRVNLGHFGEGFCTVFHPQKIFILIIILTNFTASSMGESRLYNYIMSFPSGV